MFKGFFIQQFFRCHATHVEPNEYREHHRLVLNYAANFCFSAKNAAKMKKNRFVFKNSRFPGSAITYYKCLRVFFLTVFPMSRRPRRAKRVSRTPLFDTKLCCEFLLFSKKRLKNDKKIKLFSRFSDFQDLLSQINLEAISIGVFFWNSCTAFHAECARSAHDANSSRTRSVRRERLLVWYVWISILPQQKSLDYFFQLFF